MRMNARIFLAIKLLASALISLLVWPVNAANPLIQVWYGPNQSFGALGQPQQWVNVLGNVSDADGISSLSYSLNGGPSNALSLGPDGRRLAAAGDFNVELAFSELQVGANSVVITATDGVGDQATQVVTVNYSGVNAWPRSYSTDWASAATISDQGQIIDGLWSLGAGSVRPQALGYDRLLGVGDVTWDNFEATVPITVHGLDPACNGIVNPQCASDPGVGLLIRWQGHYDEDGSQPRWGYIPLGALGWVRWRVQNLGNDSLDLLGSNSLFGRLPAKDLPFEVPHMLKVRVETDALGHTYNVKLWEQGQAEPVGWDITGQDALSDGLSYGSLLLLAHHVDASFGDVTVTPLSTDTVAPVLSAIQASAADTSATITWTTDEPANSAVAHGPTSAYENGSVTDGFYVTTHSVTLTGLLPNTQYHYQVSSADGSANAASSVDLTFTTTDPGNPAGISTDLFDAGSLDTGVWSVVDPLGDSSVTMTGSQLSIAVPAGVSHDVWVGGNFAPRVMQPVNDADFEIEVKLDAPVDTQFQLQGMLVEQDSANFIRFDFFSDGSTTNIFAATFNNGNPTTRNNAIIPGGAPLYMRVRREGDQWTQWYSNDGLSWVVATSFTHALSVTSVGVFAGNAGGSPPAHTALFDYFLVNPLVADTTPPAISNVQVNVTDSIASIKWQTDETADSRVLYGQTSAYEIGFVSETVPVTQHEVTLTKLLPGQIYHYMIESSDGNGNTATSTDLTFTTDAADPGVSGGVYSADTEVTYKEYWVSHDEFTAGCGADEVPPPSYFIEPGPSCTKTVTLTIPDDASQALKAEIYLDLWRNRDVPSVQFTLNGNDTTYAPGVGSDWSRTPYVGQVLMSELIQGVNTLTFDGPEGDAHIHDIAIRIYYDGSNPLIAGGGSDVTPPTGNLLSIQADNGSFSPSAGGELIVDNNQLVLQAAANNTSYVEFHAFYYGYDENNDGEFIDWHNVKHLEDNPGPNGTIDHPGTDNDVPFSVTWDISHIPNQTDVKFKIRLVDASGNVRESAGGVSADFSLSRSQLVESYLIQNFEDIALFHGGSEPTLASRNINLPADLSDVTAAYLVGAYWNNPFISLNGNTQFEAFTTGEDSWELSIRQLTLSDLIPGQNQIDYLYSGAGFGEFIEKPGPMVVLVRSRSGASPGGLVTDDFNSAGLDGDVWTYLDPLADSALTMNGSQMSLALAAGTVHDIWITGNLAPRIVQPAANTDFATDVKFDSVPTLAGQGQGLLVEEDANEFLVFEIRRDSFDTKLVAIRYADGQASTVSSVPVSVTAPFYLRVERQGDSWSQLYSGDGVNWTAAATFTELVSVRNVGVYASNTGSAPAYTVLVDSFTNKQPLITTQPVSQTVLEGQSATFSVVASGNPPLTYQWRRDGVDIAGETNDSYTLPLVSLADDQAGFSVVVTSGEGIGITSDTAFINIDVGLPVAGDDPTAATTPEDTAVKTVNVLANDTLVDNAVISAFDNTSVNGGTVVNNLDGTFHYMPASGFNGSDSFTYTLTDEELDSSTATVTVSVTPVDNGVPFAVDDPTAATTPEDTAVITLNVLANDTLVDNAVISSFDNPSINGGTVVDNLNGTFTYTPASGFNGTDSFTYILTDDELDSSIATVTVSVTPVDNGMPVAVDDPAAATTPEDTAVTTVNVLANDTLVDNAVISAFDNPSANGGTVVDNSDGTFTYTPASGFNGSDSFTYTLTDDELDASTATVTVTVTPATPDGDLAPWGAPDGQLNAADLMIMQRMVLGEITPTALDLLHGDLYPPGAPDGVIDMSDLILQNQLIFQVGPP